MEIINLKIKAVRYGKKVHSLSVTCLTVELTGGKGVGVALLFALSRVEVDRVVDSENSCGGFSRELEGFCLDLCWLEDTCKKFLNSQFNYTIQ